MLKTNVECWKLMLNNENECWLLKKNVEKNWKRIILNVECWNRKLNVEKRMLKNGCWKTNVEKRMWETYVEFWNQMMKNKC